MRCIGTVAEEMLFHLHGEIFARACIGQHQAVFADQHGLMLEPASLGFFGVSDQYEQKIFLLRFPYASNVVYEEDEEKDAFAVLSEKSKGLNWKK